MTIEKKSNQLHQILAVENEKKNTANAIMKETQKTFKEKQTHYDGEIRSYLKLDEDSDDLPNEEKRLVDTVKSKLEYTAKSIIELIDVLMSKEETNASGVAVAELEVDDVNFGMFSATGLLQLESQLKDIREIYKAIPTQDPVKKWEWNEKKGFYETPAETTYRSIKITEPQVVVPATDKFPAQVSAITRDKQVGKWEKIYQSGRLTPAQKSKLLANIDRLINAVKKARSKANNAEVKNIKIGKKLFDFINEPIKKEA